LSCAQGKDEKLAHQLPHSHVNPKRTATNVTLLCAVVLPQARAEEDAERHAGVSGLLAKAAAVRAEDAFKSAAAAEVFGSMSGSGMGLDARINSRRHYNQR
jgi:hypothetical protein